MARCPLRTIARQAGLTERETEILVLGGGGYDEEQIAARLGISVSGVRSHTSNARRKLREEVGRRSVFEGAS